MKIISGKCRSIKRSGKLSRAGHGRFQTENTRAPCLALQHNRMGARRRGGKTKRLCTFWRVLFILQRFLPFCVPTLIHTHPGRRWGARPCPAGLPAPKRRACGSPTVNGGEGAAPLPPCGLDFAALANSAPGFHEHHHPETMAIYTSPAFAHPHNSQLPLPLSRVNPNCLHPPACWVLTLQNLNIWGPKPPAHVVTQF